MKKKKMKLSKTISFDEEIVPKHIAEKILAEEPKTTEERKNNESDENEDVSRAAGNQKKRKTIEHDETDVNERVSRKKKKKPKNEEKNDECHQDQSQEERIEFKKHKKKKEPKLSLTEEISNTNGEENKQHKDQKEESIRAKKRKRHAQLLEEKKLKADLAMQQKALNYLSKWKHSREEWKFEKLKQIWLQHNMYDTSKVPEEFWDVLVEYLGNSKGKARGIILQDALKLIDCSEEDSESEIKVKRARDIVQNLQE